MIDLEWVSDYIDISDQDPKDLARKITEAGINIEKVITNHIDNLVIGKVLECEKIKGTHLNKCLVDVNEKIQIVCGAKNVKKGIKVIVALPGAVLPGNVTIKKSKIQGYESNGMICALFELGLEEKNEENYNKGITILPDDAKVGEDPLRYLNLDSTLYELDIHKHRNNDCYYHIGFAYEIAAILNRKVSLPNIKHSQIKENVKDYLNLEVKTDKCPYYLAKMVKDVKIGPSPDFIRRRLNAYGMRSINNLVDISNYVMLEFGQPLHFFDKDSLGDKILVRNAKEGEELTTLDGIDRKLSKDDIVITDGEKPICLAGVMGGENTEITDNTKNILIESAIFDPVSIRYTAKRHNLPSEASIRYGKGLNYEYTDMAIERACFLLEKYAGAKVLTGVVKYDNVDKKDEVVEFTSEEISKLLGIEISDESVKTELNRLDFPFEFKYQTFKVTIPKRRLDIDPNVNDIAEEVGRLYGYNNLKDSLPCVPIRRGEYIGDVKYRKIISKRLRSLGLNEVKTHTLVSPELSKLFDYENKEKVVLPNPMSIDKSIVRTSLIPSLLEVYKYNKARGVDDILIYEIAKTYDKKYNEESKITMLLKESYIKNTWQNINVKVDFYLLKGIIEDLLDYLGFKNRYSFVKKRIDDLHPGISASIIIDGKEVGIIGKVHPNIVKDDIYVAELSLNKLMISVSPIKFVKGQEYPKITKDASFIVNKDVPSEEIEKTIRKSGGKLLKEVHVFDVYTGDKIDKDKKSIAYDLVFYDQDRTLKDSEVNELFNKIINDVIKKNKAILRDK